MNRFCDEQNLDCGDGFALAAEFHARGLAASGSQELVLRIQQARAYARYLQGGEKHGTVVEDHVLTPEEAAAAVREELDAALVLLGARA